MIGLIGLNHQTSDIYLREKLSLNNNEIVDFLALLRFNLYVKEVVVLSTCNRTEVYFNIEDCCVSGCVSIIINTLFQYKNIDYSNKRYFYDYIDEQAIEHLFKVVSGLDSMLIGEYQIVSQVKQALNISKEHKFTGKFLDRLFSKSLEVSKVVRCSMQVDYGAMSLGYVAVEKCFELLGSFTDKTLLLIGIGETGETVIKHFVKKGLKNILISNRTYQHALAVAERYSAKVVSFESYIDSIELADIIITSTSSKNNLIVYDSIKPPTYDKIFFDLSVPRNIDDNISKIEKISLYNIDDLKDIVEKANETKKSKIDNVKHIIEEEVLSFSQWMSAQNLTPAIKNINIALKYIKHKEIAKLKPRLSTEDYQNLNEFGDLFSKRIRKELISRLKEITEDGKRTEYLKVINDLFLVKPKN